MIFTTENQPTRSPTTRPTIKIHLIDQLRQRYPAWDDESDGKLIEMVIREKLQSDDRPITTTNYSTQEEHTDEYDFNPPKPGERYDDPLLGL